MIGQTVCMCAEIAQGKQKLAWELNHLSTVPLSGPGLPPPPNKGLGRPRPRTMEAQQYKL